MRGYEMEKRVIGILAHVDSGKTTLSEALLYKSGKTRKLGRVDNQDAYLDTYDLEKARGITIFSKQAVFEYGGISYNLLDTPGHVDFSAEMERTLQVLDYAILVVSGADGVQGHTKTVWRLLESYKVPTFIFVNKMDQEGATKEMVLSQIKRQLSDHCIDFTDTLTASFSEEIALTSEALMHQYLTEGNVSHEAIIDKIAERCIFPVFFGSALKMQGIDAFIEGLSYFTQNKKYVSAFGARIFKIARDEQGNRLTYMKITGGSLSVKDQLITSQWSEKVNQIRIYSGSKYEIVTSVDAGTVCAVTGLSQSKAGEGLGIEADKDGHKPLLEPVLNYQLVFPESSDARMMLPKLKQIEDEEPELSFEWDEETSNIQVNLFGEVQTEILQSIVLERFDVLINYGHSRIVYKETILDTVEGVGHFEPLRHYSEVHLLLEPLPRGSGLQFETNCSEDELAKNWQRLVLTHLGERAHRGVLIGAELTDVKITLVAGRAHNKHTEGGDFREATFRAVRQGLMEAESQILEPYYSFQLHIPDGYVGRAMTDIDQRFGRCEVSLQDGGWTLLTGTGPVSTLRNYYKEVVAYTKGEGLLFMSVDGYDVCHNTEAVFEAVSYDPERDLRNPSASVFCAQGTGFIVSWDQVKDYMHVPSVLKPERQLFDLNAPVQETVSSGNLSLEEIDSIINQTAFANSGRKSMWRDKRRNSERLGRSYGAYETDRTGKSGRETDYNTLKLKESYLLVDGYNVVFAWDELKALSETSLDAARDKLLERLSDYQAIKKSNIIVVFDAYKVPGRRESVEMYHNIKVIFTAEAQTADQYIEKFAHDHNSEYQITVATSDGMQQMIIRGAGCLLLSSRELKEDMERVSEEIRSQYLKTTSGVKSSVDQGLSEADLEKLRRVIKDSE